MEDEAFKRKLVILAVDDSHDILKAIVSILRDEYNVVPLPNPTMLENTLQQVTPELFLLDYKMPDINGFDLIPIIRNFKEHKCTPIVFLTSEGTVDRVSTALALGACDFIVKPFRADVLREKIAKHIVRKKTVLGSVKEPVVKSDKEPSQTADIFEQIGEFFPNKDN
jgi:putative two-component system response regulator